MPAFTESAVDTPGSAELLDEYFAYRAATFPVAGGYRAAHPAPEAFTRPSGVFVLVHEAGVAIGCGGVRMLSGDRAEIKHLWLRPVARGRGLGRALLTELERLASELGATEVVLDTNSSLIVAGALYRSSGYEAVAAYNDNPNATEWYRKPI